MCFHTIINNIEMTDNQEIRIRLLDGRNKSWIMLQGTVLTYREQRWSQETIVDIPVELISITEKKQIMGTRFGVALLWLLFSFLTVILIAIAINLQNNSLTTNIYAIISTFIVIIPFIILIIRSFFRQRTITFTIAPKNGKISFWVEKKNKNKIDFLLSELVKCKEYVNEKVPYPLHSAIGERIQQPWKRTIIFTLLLAYPSMVFDQPKLLLLCLIPIIMHLWNLIFLIRQPALYRDAVRYCLNKQWDKATVSKEQLMQQSPSYIPGYLLFIQILLRLDQFDRAEKVLGSIQNKLEAEFVDTVYLEIVDRKRLFDRKAMPV